MAFVKIGLLLSVEPTAPVNSHLVREKNALGGEVGPSISARAGKRVASPVTVERGPAALPAMAAVWGADAWAAPVIEALPLQRTLSVCLHKEIRGRRPSGEDHCHG